MQPVTRFHFGDLVFLKKTAGKTAGGWTYIFLEGFSQVCVMPQCWVWQRKDVWVDLLTQWKLRFWFSWWRRRGFWSCCWSAPRSQNQTVLPVKEQYFRSWWDGFVNSGRAGNHSCKMFSEWRILLPLGLSQINILTQEHFLISTIMVWSCSASDSFLPFWPESTCKSKVGAARRRAGPQLILADRKYVDSWTNLEVNLTHLVFSRLSVCRLWDESGRDEQLWKHKTKIYKST